MITNDWSGTKPDSNVCSNEADDHTRECRTWSLGMAIHAHLAASNHPPTDAVRLAWVLNYADGLQESGVCSCAQLALVDRGLDA